MKQASRIVLVVLTLAVVLFARIGPAYAMQSADSSGSQTTKTIFTGAIEKMDGNQWVVNGKTVSVDPRLAASGKFSLGDTVKVEGVVRSDGSVSAKSVELPSSANDNSNSKDAVTKGNSNGNSNDSSVSNSNGSTDPKDKHSNSNSNEGHSHKDHSGQSNDNSNSSNDNSNTSNSGNDNSSKSNNANSNNG